MSSIFCPMNCARPANTQMKDRSCCQQCIDSNGNTNNHTTQCDKLYNEYLMNQFTQNTKNMITEKWACNVCTFQNESFRTKCQICTNPKPQNKQPSNTNTDIIMKSPLKQQQKRRKRKYQEICKDDSDDSDIVILNNNKNHNKRRKIDPNANNSCNNNNNNSKQCEIDEYEMKLMKKFEDINPMDNCMEKYREKEEEIIDPRLMPMKTYHGKRQLMIDIPGDHIIDYDLMDSTEVKLQCFHHEKLIRMEQDRNFDKYKNKIKAVNDKVNKTPQEVFNYKINEYYVHENTQMVQMQRMNWNPKKKLDFSEDNKVLLFCSCCLNKPKTVPNKNNKLTEEQKAKIEKNRLAALERLKKNGLNPSELRFQRKRNKRNQIELETLMRNKVVVYGHINEITVDNHQNNQQTINMLIRIKYSKHLTEYDSDASNHKSFDFHNLADCNFYIIKELSQFGTFGLQLKNIETFFSATIIQLGSSWCNKYYYIDGSIGNGAPLLTIREITNILAQHETLKILKYPLDVIGLISQFIGECEQYEEIKTMNNNLNQSQIRAIYNVSQNAVSVIQGPPGTGKTYTAVNIVQRFRELHKEARIILTAHTHAACDQILAHMVNYAGTNNLDITRFCNQSQMKEQDLIRFSHREKMKHHEHYNEMQQLFIDAKNRRIHRTERENARQRAKDMERIIIVDIVEKSDVIIMTCFAAAGYMIIQSDINFDLIIIDESTQIIETEVIGVINLLNQNRSRMSSLKWMHRMGCSKKKKMCEESDDDEYDEYNMFESNSFSERIKQISNFNKKIVMIGDPKQLSPVINSNEAKYGGLGITWFQRILSKMSLNELMNKRYCNKYMINDNEIFTMLNVQRRGWDILHNFNSLQFYNGRIKHFYKWNQINQLKPKQLIGGFNWENNKPFNFVAINSRQRSKLFENSYDNPKEAKCIKNIIRNILAYGNDNRYNDKQNVIQIKTLKQIGVITTHVQQKLLLKREIKDAYGAQIAKELIVETVDAFQGQEKELIIFSLCRTDCKNTTFMCDEKRINVMLSRAQNAMIIVGNITELSTNNIFSNLRQYLNDHGVIKRI